MPRLRNECGIMLMLPSETAAALTLLMKLLAPSIVPVPVPEPAKLGCDASMEDIQALWLSYGTPKKIVAPPHPLLIGDLSHEEWRTCDPRCLVRTALEYGIDLEDVRNIAGLVYSNVTTARAHLHFN